MSSAVPAPRKTAAAKKTSQPTVTALQRGLEILRCFDFVRGALGSSEIARITGLPQPTVWRLCKTLEQEGYLVWDSETSRFRPGLAVLTLGYAALGTLDLAELARPHLQSIADRFEGAAGLATRDRLSMLYLQRCEASNAFLKINLRVGSEIPIAHSGTGWAYLAGLAAPARESLIEEIRRGSPDYWRRGEKPFRTAFEEFARTGYVLNVDTFFNGLSTVAVPLGGARDANLYVLYISAMSTMLDTDKRRREAGQALLDAVRKLKPIFDHGPMRPPR